MLSKMWYEQKWHTSRRNKTKTKLNEQKRARGNIFLTISFFFFHTHILLHPSSNSRGVQGTAYHTQPEWYALLTKLLGAY